MPVLNQKRAKNTGQISHRSGNGGQSARTTARGDSQVVYGNTGNNAAEQSSMCLFDHRNASCKRSDAEELAYQDTLLFNEQPLESYGQAPVRMITHQRVFSDHPKHHEPSNNASFTSSLMKAKAP